MKLLSCLLPKIKESLDVQLDSRLADDIMHGVITNRDEGAGKFSKGNKNVFGVRLDELTYEALAKVAEARPSSFSKAQLAANKIYLRRYVVDKLLMIGQREPAIILAESTYHIAASNHHFDTAAHMALRLSKHYGQYVGDTGKSEMYFERYKAAQSEHDAAMLAMHLCDLYLSKIRKTKSVKPEDVAKLSDDVATIGKYAESCNSYRYWYEYFQLQIFLHDARLEYEKLYGVACQAYEYFNELFFDHKAAKLAMISYKLTALIGLKRYNEAAELAYLIEANKTAVGNYRLCQMHMMRVYLNLSQPARARELYEAYFSSASSYNEIDEMAQVYNIYALLMQGDSDVTITKSYARDPLVMSAAIRVAQAWKTHLSEVYDMPVDASRRYLNRYFEKDTRTAVFIKLMCILPLKEYEPDRYNRKRLILLADLDECDPEPIEAEVIDYKTLWSIFDKTKIKQAC